MTNIFFSLNNCLPKWFLRTTSLVSPKSDLPQKTKWKLEPLIQESLQTWGEKARQMQNKILSTVYRKSNFPCFKAKFTLETNFWKWTSYLNRHSSMWFMRSSNPMDVKELLKKSPWFKSWFNLMDHFRKFVSRENVALLTLLLVVEAHKNLTNQKSCLHHAVIWLIFLTCIDIQHFNDFFIATKKINFEAVWLWTSYSHFQKNAA